LADLDLSGFLSSFFDEAQERLNSINQGLVDFESKGLDDEGLVLLRRDAHTIKGSALMLGVEDIGHTAHLFEDMMELLIEHPSWRRSETTQFLFDLHDRLEDRLQYVDTEKRIDLDGLRSQYDNLVQALKEQDGATEADKSALDTPEKDKVDVSGLIGADEAEDWKKQRAQQRLEDTASVDQDNEKDVDNSLNELIDELAEPIEWDASDDISDTEESVHDAPTPLPSSPFGDLDNYRPDIQKIEMQTTARRQSSGRFLRVDAERLERLSNQVIELSTEQSRNESAKSGFMELTKNLRNLQREWRYFARSMMDMDQAKREKAIASLHRGFDEQVRKSNYFVDESSFSQIRSELMFKDLRDQVLSLMLRPLDSIFSTFPRSVRDIAVRLNKRARLMIGGEGLEMDQGVAEALVEPLMHLLNNAVAHGIEAPEERLALGKPEEGQISIIARQNGNEIRIEVIDDGQGLDVEKIKKFAVERGVSTQYEVDNMDSAEILELIFRPGFSTTEVVDDTSGRGIGMNVVQSVVRRLTGSIRIHSKKGEGTRFTLSIPVSIAVQHALMFRMGNMRFGMLTHMVEQALPLHQQKIEIGAGDKSFIEYGKHQVPIVDMRSVLGGNAELSRAPSVIIAEHIEGYVGIVVDELMADTEIMVRDLDPYIKRYQPQGLMGNTIASDGSVVMLLEPYGIKEMGRTSPNQEISIDVSDEEKMHFRILLVDDSLIAREIEKRLFESIGFTVDTAIDGIDGIEKMQIENYDMIITDLEMPRLDGFGFVRHIRNQHQYEDLPVMVISTRESAEDRLRALESGADTYMVKQQLNGDDILKTVQTLVGSLT